MHTVLNAFNIEKGEYELRTQYKGTNNVFVFLDIEDEDLQGELSEIFYNTVCHPHVLGNAEELALSISF